MPYFYVLFQSFIIYVTATARSLFLLSVIQIHCKGKVCLVCWRCGHAFRERRKLIAEHGKGSDLLDSGFSMWTVALTKGCVKQRCCPLSCESFSLNWHWMEAFKYIIQVALLGWNELYCAAEENCVAWSWWPLCFFWSVSMKKVFHALSRGKKLEVVLNFSP